MKKRAVYPGSFDPITNGHLDVLVRAQKLFDEVVIAVAANSSKQSLFTLEERVALVRETTKDLNPAPIVTCLDGLLVDFVEKQEACAIVRGLRAVSDFEYELQIALTNRKLKPDVETIFLMPRESYTYLSSSIVRELARLGGDIGAFVPPSIQAALRLKFSKK